MIKSNPKARIDLKFNFFKESESTNYAYSTYTSSNYNTINKRSAIYLNSSNRNDLSSALQPLKPDVIREHKDHSIIYGPAMTNRSSSHDYSTPHLQFITPASLPRRSTNYSNNVYVNDTPIYIVEKDNQSYDPNALGGAELSRTTMTTTPSGGSDSTSSSNHSSGSSTRSSKSFEENIEEYLEPEYDDLSKPEPKAKSTPPPPTEDNKTVSHNV